MVDYRDNNALVQGDGHPDIHRRPQLDLAILKGRVQPRMFLQCPGAALDQDSCHGQLLVPFLENPPQRLDTGSIHRDFDKNMRRSLEAVLKASGNRTAHPGQFDDSRHVSRMCSFSAINLPTIPGDSSLYVCALDSATRTAA